MDIFCPAASAAGLFRNMDSPDTPSQPASDPDAPTPPEPPRRSPLEVAALFLGLTLALFLWWRAQQPTNSREATAITLTVRAERFAQAALAAPQRPGQERPNGLAWKQAREQYRRALVADPQLPRARRGLAAMDFLEGNVAEAKRLMQGPARIPEGEEGVWRAFQFAFGARPVPGAGKTLEDARSALQRRSLGWSRFVALKALAGSSEEAARWDRALHRRDAPTPFSGGLGVAIGVVAFLAMLAGISILSRYLADPPPNRLLPLNVPANSLIVLSVVCLLVAQFPSLFLRMALASRGVTDPTGGQMIGLTAAGTLAGVLLMLPVAHVLLRSLGSGLGEIGWSTKGLFRWSLGGYLAMLPLLGAAVIASNALNELFPNVPTPDNPAAGLAASASGYQVALVLLFASVFVPITEEFVMRGLLFRGLAKRYGVTIAAVAASFLFAGLHPQLPAGFPPLFVIGLGLCHVYRASGSLVPCIVIHGFSNGLILLMEWLTFR